MRNYVTFEPVGVFPFGLEVACGLKLQYLEIQISSFEAFERSKK